MFHNLSCIFEGYLEFYIYVCSSCISVGASCACLVTEEAREDDGIPGTGITDVCELPCGCWELNPGLQENLVFLTAKPSV